MICSNCGAELADGAKFCGVCGTPVVMEAASRAAENVQAAAADAAPAFEAPVFDTPVLEAPAPEAPVFTAPVFETPQQPTYQQPVYQEPVYQQPTYQQPTYQVPNDTPVVDEQERASAKSVLTMGILSVAFAAFFYTAILGVIFGAIGLGKAKTYAAQYQTFSPKARIGKYLSLGGLIAGIIFAVIVFFIIVAAIIAAMN